MKARDWFIVFGSFFFVVLLDQVTKRNLFLFENLNLEYFKFYIVHNKGLLLGAYSDIPSILRVVLLSTAGALLFGVYFLIQYMVSGRQMALRLGITILMAGAIGNVVDRIQYGYVIDFLSIKVSTLFSTVLNVADISQWVGYGLILYALFKADKNIIPRVKNKSVLWVNKKFQLKQSFFMVGVGLLLTLVTIVFSYTYLKITLIELVGINKDVTEKILEPFLISVCLLFTLFSIILFFVGQMMSKRIAGPIFAFERFLSGLIDDQVSIQTSHTLKLRSDDEFKNLEFLASKVKNKFQKMNIEKFHRKLDFED